MKKILSMLCLMVLAIGTAWAETETESSGNTGENNKPWNGTSCILDGKYIAGKGGVKQGNMPDKGVKLRSNQGNLVFEINAGIKITSFKFWAAGNTTTTVDVASVSVDGADQSKTGTIPGKGESTSFDLSLTDLAATDNITITFAEGSSAQIVGTWQIEYEVTEVIVQEISAVTLNGAAISDEDLATLKSDKAVTIDGSSLNGLGAVAVTLSSGATTVNRAIADGNATYTFTINSTDEYTITVTDVAKTYDAEEGSVVYYSKDGSEVEGASSNTVTANGITFAMNSKTFQYGSGSVTLGETKYVPLKLSTGEAVNVTFPDGKVATKVRIYGWSANGDGSLYFIKESADATERVIDTKSDIFYATNTADGIYPSVYEYDLNNWRSFHFTAGGSASQPFVVMDFVLEDEDATTKTISLIPSIWDDADATERYAVYAFVDNDMNAWFDFTETDGKYNATIPAKYSNIILVRMNGETTENNWDNKWNQTDDIDFTAIKDGSTFTINGWGEGEGANSTYSVEAPAEPDTYAIASNLNEWNTTADAMTDNGDGTWTKTYEGVDMTALYEFKVVKNGNTWIPAEGANFKPDYFEGNGKYNVTITYDGENVTFDVDLVSMTVAPAKELTTLSSTRALDFSAVEGLEAYVVSSITSTQVTATKITEAPAETGIILKKTGSAESFSIPVVASAEAPAASLLTATHRWTYTLNDTDYQGYVLSDGSFKKATGVVPAFKAFLEASKLPTAGARDLSINFGETTGINAVESATVKNGQFFNIAGQRVAQPTKGLYIVNGKKVVIK